MTKWYINEQSIRGDFKYNTFINNEKIIFEAENIKRIPHGFKSSMLDSKYSFPDEYTVTLLFPLEEHNLSKADIVEIAEEAFSRFASKMINEWGKNKVAEEDSFRDKIIELLRIIHPSKSKEELNSILDSEAWQELVNSAKSLFEDRKKDSVEDEEDDSSTITIFEFPDVEPDIRVNTQNMVIELRKIKESDSKLYTALFKDITVTDEFGLSSYDEVFVSEDNSNIIIHAYDKYDAPEENFYEFIKYATEIHNTMLEKKNGKSDI